MGFAAPLQLFWATLLLFVVLLYLRWSSRSMHPTAALRIWQQALGQRTWWSRWRRAVSILAACVPIVLIAMALAQPYLWSVMQSARTIIAVIDATGSMNATGSEHSALAAARREASRLIDGLRTHEQMVILSADSAVHVRCRLTSDRTLLRAGVDRIQPTDGTGAMKAGIDTALALAAGQRNGVVVLLSDGAFARADTIESNENLVWIPTGAAADNVAITRLAIRPPNGGGPQHKLLVELSNASLSPARVPVAICLDGKERAKTTIDVAADAKQQRVMTIDIEEASLLTAEIQHEDALAVDNVAGLIVTPHRPTHVILSGDEASPVNLALQAIDNIEVEVSSVESTSRSAPSGNIVRVFDGDVPRAIPKGPALVIAPQQASELWEHLGEAALPGAVAVEPHPVLQGIRLEDAIVDTAMKLRFADNAQVIARAADGSPICVVLPRESGDVFVLAFSPSGSDLGLRSDFPQFIAAAIEWLTRDRRAAQSQWTTTSVLDHAAADETDRLVSPYGEEFESDVGKVLLANLDQVGQWRLAEGSSNVESVLPVNMLSSSESDLRSRAASLPTQWPESTQWPDPGPLSAIFVALALVWIIGHWVAYQRGDID